MNNNDLFQLGLNADLSVDRADPRNAKYLVPLDNEKDEDMARSMAECIVVMGCDGDESRREQALIDLRRMVLDPDYEALFQIDDKALRAKMTAALVDEVDKGSIAGLRLPDDED